jgi:hypothetical protein
MTDVVLTALTALLPLPLAWATPDSGLVAAFIAATASLASLSTLPARSFSPIRLDLQLLRGPDAGIQTQAMLPFGCAFGFAFGLAGVFAGGSDFGFTDGITTGIVIGLAVGFATGQVTGLTAEPSEAATPGVTIREDVTYGLVYGLAGGLGGGLAAGLALPGGLPVGLALGLAFGLTAGLKVSAARRYAVFLVCSRGRLPFRLARFLDWACTAGLMRYSGPAYQFRHRELQQWLAAHPDPVI